MKLYYQGITHSQEVEWWIIPIVECVDNACDCWQGYSGPPDKLHLQHGPAQKPHGTVCIERGQRFRRSIFPKEGKFQQLESSSILTVLNAIKPSYLKRRRFK